MPRVLSPNSSGSYRRQQRNAIHLSNVGRGVARSDAVICAMLNVSTSRSIARHTNLATFASCLAAMTSDAPAVLPVTMRLNAGSRQDADQKTRWNAVIARTGTINSSGLLKGSAGVVPPCRLLTAYQCALFLQ